MVGIKCKMDYPESLAVTRFSRKIIVPTYLELYANRLDKGYSLTDCVSMVVMKQMGIYEILTHDKHFAQEGLTILF